MKKIFGLAGLGLALTLASCSSGPSAPEVAAPTTVIKGQVLSGTGTGTVSLKDGADVLAQAAVDTQGNFSLALPGKAVMTPKLVAASQVLSRVGCEGTLSATPRNGGTAEVRGYGVGTLALERGSLKTNVVAMDGSNTPFLGIPDVTVEGYAWIYTDQAASVTGNVDCRKLVGMSMNIPVSVNFTTNEGWNVVRLNAKAGASTGGAVKASLTASNDVQAGWRSLDDLGNKLK